MKFKKKKPLNPEALVAKVARKRLKELKSAKSKRTIPPAQLQAAQAFQRQVLDWTHHDPAKQVSLRPIITRIIALAQTLAEKQFYPYQVELGYRIVESLLLHDGEVISALISRQAGKTETLASVVAACGMMLPQLARQFPDDWKFNITDEKGVYRGYRDGVRIGIYAPRLEQAEIMFNRIKHALESDTGKQVMQELGLKSRESNGDRIRLSNGTRILCQSASEQSKIEGETHHFLICEECQDISDLKIRKSLHPMVSSLLGTIVKIGTATTRKCDFYNAIKTNERLQLMGRKKNHFFYPYTVTQQFNSLYRKYVDAEADRLGVDSDEFRLAYGCEWIFERGMFVTQPQLFDNRAALSNGSFSIFHPYAKHSLLRYFSIVVGIDWGKSSDSTVMTIMAVNWNDPIEKGDYEDLSGMHEYQFFKKHVLDWVEFVGDNYEVQFWSILDYLQQIPFLKKIVMDSNTCGQAIYDRFAARFLGSGIDVVPFNFTPRLKSDGYKSLYSDFCGHRLTFPASQAVRATVRWKKFVNQMLDLRKEYKGGLMAVAHPEEKGAHDDYPDSIMMAAWGASAASFATNFEVANHNMFFSR